MNIKESDYQTRLVALKLRHKTYTSPLDCKHRHGKREAGKLGNLRYSKSGICVTCQKLAAKTSRKRAQLIAAGAADYAREKIEIEVLTRRRDGLDGPAGLSKSDRDYLNRLLRKHEANPNPPEIKNKTGNYRVDTAPSNPWD